MRAVGATQRGALYAGVAIEDATRGSARGRGVELASGVNIVVVGTDGAKALYFIALGAVGGSCSQDH